jgi:hypothetical protein
MNNKTIKKKMLLVHPFPLDAIVGKGKDVIAQPSTSSEH